MMNASRHTLIVVTPVYEDADACARLFTDLAATFGTAVFVVAVDDGSVRQPLDIRTLEQAGLEGEILRLRRNVGHQRAIAIGLARVSEHLRPDQRVVVMDADGEDVPSTIPALLAALEDPAVDVVVARRQSRVETLRFKIFYAVYKRFFRTMTGRTIDFGNFMALKPAALQRLVSMQELSIHVAGAVLASRLRTRPCALDRGARYAGHSQMNFVGLALHGFKALMVFAEDVLVRVGIACTIIASLSLLGSAAAVVLKLTGFSTPGWFSVALGLLLLMLLQTGALALMTLMLTGVVRGGTVTNEIAYHAFIAEVIRSAPHGAGAAPAPGS